MSIELHHLTKRYDGAPVVDDVSLTIGAGELFVLLGPSGSGKSTLLRMIAGLAEVEQGQIVLHGRDVTTVSPKDRGIGFVFQHYALFRHLSVADNIEFALNVRKVGKAQRRQRCEELLQLVGLSGFAARYPRQLSGGQQQRVALARALAHAPEVLLLDEPFGALDARIRGELRQALRSIQRELGLTTVFVTHDQEEAFELSDRLAVLHQGRLLEVGEPRELYLRPRSPFVATFLGNANLLVGESTPKAVRLGSVELPVASEVASGRGPRRVQVLFRPEDVELATTETSQHPRLGRGVVVDQSFVGAFEKVQLRIPPLESVRGVSPVPTFGSGDLLIQAVRPQHESVALPLSVGATVWVAVRRFHVLAPASLRLLVDKGDSPSARAAQAFARALAESVGARIATLGDEALRENADPEHSSLGAETESRSEGFDVALLALEPKGLPPRLDGLALARHHLLLIASPAPLPTRLLICVAVGEPGKADVRFAERLAWQLHAKATILTVLPAETSAAEESPPAHVARFLTASVKALSARGVPAEAKVRRGSVEQEIRAEILEGGHDLVVLGAPQPSEDRPRARKASPVEQLTRRPPACPLLIVRV